MLTYFLYMLWTFQSFFFTYLHRLDFRKLNYILGSEFYMGMALIHCEVILFELNKLKLEFINYV